MRSLVKRRKFRCSVASGVKEAIDLDILDTAPRDSLKNLYSLLIKQCGRSKNLADAKRIHSRLAGRDNQLLDRFLANLLIEMYGKCGSVPDARRVFDAIRGRKNVYTWTIMIAAAASNGSKRLAMDLFCAMDLEGESPNSITYVVALDACSSLREGRLLYDSMVVDGSLARGHTLANALITMYGKFQQLGEAYSIFKRAREARDVVTWNAMIAALAQNGHFDRAMGLLRDMDLEPDAVTFIGLIAGIESLEQGRSIHAMILATPSIDLQRDTNLSNALISLYGKFHSLLEARSVFDLLHRKDLVSWNAILLASAQNGEYAEILELYQAMDWRPDQRTFLVVLDACANLSEIRQGKATHSQISRRKLDGDALVGNSLVYMYARFGCVEDARLAFQRIKQRDVISWTAIIAAHFQNGLARESLHLFLEMQLQGLKPDLVTFGCLLAACSYAGLVHKARDHFTDIWREYDLIPSPDNFVTMIDVLSKAGWLEDAEELMETMPFFPDPVAWTMLLGTCKVFGDVSRGKRICERVLGEEPIEQAPYHILLSNLYAENTGED